MAMTDVARRGDGAGLTGYERAQAIVANGIGDYRAAMEAAKRNADNSEDLGGTWWVLTELVEAASRCGEPDIAAQALARLSETTRVSGSDWALGIEARSRALCTDGESAGLLYEESIERLGRTRMRAELARAHLLYGEWLRRRRHRTEARTQLRIAHSMLDQMGMQAFAERARRELQATGETARKSAPPTMTGQLTPQEAQIARLASEGMSNAEIGARLFISARTVQYHLRKVFSKLDITSRTQLHRVLPPEH
jgi:DNA-binding CsgD family transcriptional regulator